MDMRHMSALSQLRLVSVEVHVGPTLTCRMCSVLKRASRHVLRMWQTFTRMVSRLTLHPSGQTHLYCVSLKTLFSSASVDASVCLEGDDRSVRLNRITTSGARKLSLIEYVCSLSDAFRSDLSRDILGGQCLVVFSFETRVRILDRDPVAISAQHVCEHLSQQPSCDVALLLKNSKQTFLLPVCKRSRGIILETASAVLEKIDPL